MADYNDTYNEVFALSDFADDDEFLTSIAWADGLQESDSFSESWVFAEVVDASGEPIVQAVTFTDAMSDALVDVFSDVLSFADSQIIYTEEDDFVEAIAFTDSFADVLGDAFADSISWTDVIDDVTAAAIDTFAESITWADTLAETLAFTETFAESWAWSDTLDDLVSADYACWVMGDTGAFTRYDNFEFDSYAALPDGTILAADDNGLYALEGDDDDGTDIAASITYGLSDFNTSDMKRMVRLTLGLSAPANALVIKQRLEADGVIDEHWVQPAGGGTTTAPKNKVYKLLQGVKGRYCGLIIANKAGADFDITETHLHLSRVGSQQ